MRNVLQSLKLAIKSILVNKLRSLLTMLGIIIGVASVIILVSIVSGYMGQMVEQFEEMGANKINVFCRNMRTRHIDDKDMYEFWDEHPNWFSGISPTITLSNVTIKYNGKNTSSTIITGVSEDYTDIEKYKLEEGRSILYVDVFKRTCVCVIGKYVANTFFGSSNKSINSKLRINGKPFTIVGVIEAQDEDNLVEAGMDNFILIPYTVAIKMNKNSYINDYVLNSSDTNYTEEITKALKNHLHSVFNDEKSYNVFANSSMIKELNESISALTTMIAGIAGISLLVAGIGIMNIMLVSVTERTNEIGIRKALGARQSVIMQQFIIEAAVISTIGGIIGIILGSFVTNIIGSIMEIKASPTLWAIVLSFCISIIIGVIFGYAPAKNAAMLNPIDALKSA